MLGFLFLNRSALYHIATLPPAELSNDLNVITAEINAYQRVAGEAIFEIGRRLKHVKENDLAHGQFGKWLESVGIHPRVAQQMMKIVTELDGKASTYSYLGQRVLYEIATLPPDQRDQPHTIPSTGEVKTVDEMTVRELLNFSGGCPLLRIVSVMPDGQARNEVAIHR